MLYVVVFIYLWNEYDWVTRASAGIILAYRNPAHRLADFDA
jgi:hypothetical protein